MQTTLTLGGKSVRLDQYEPKSTAPRPAILLLHGAGGNVDFWLERLAPMLAQAGIAAFAVHYFDRTGTIRADHQTLSDGVHIPLWLSTIREALGHLTQLPEIDPYRIGLVGISLGAFLALATASDPAVPHLRAVAEVSGGLVQPYADAATSAFPPTLILHGDADTVVSVHHAHDLEHRLDELKVPHEMRIFRNENHFFSELAQARILARIVDFLIRRL